MRVVIALIVVALSVACLTESTTTDQLLSLDQQINQIHQTIASLPKNTPNGYEHTTTNAPPTPQIYSSFSARMNRHLAWITEDSKGEIDQPGLTYENRANSSRVDDITMDIYPGYPYSFRYHYFTENTAVEVNGVCRFTNNTKYNNQFAWLPLAKYMGQRLFDNKQVDMWQLKLFTFSLSLYNIGSTPVQMNLTINSKTTQANVTTTFTDVAKMNQWPVGFFSVPKSCTPPGPICPVGPVQRLDVYRVRKREQVDLAYHNGADALGDALFVCQIVTGFRPSTSNLVSIFNVEINSTFGVYAPCNDGYCDSINKILVGRQAPEGVKPYGGQCEDNSDVGTWYSFDGVNECKPNQKIGDDSCVWKQLGISKTITFDCLLSHGIKEACEKDGLMPYPRAGRILENAMLFNLPTLGGCPNV